MEEELSLRMKRAGATAREPVDDSTSDAGDESVAKHRFYNSNPFVVDEPLK
jgi:hypothetical protein